jgi:probable addiction module antidote protein
MLAKFLNDALAAGDTIVFVKAIGDLIRAQGMTEVSQKTGLDRTAL